MHALNISWVSSAFSGTATSEEEASNVALAMFGASNGLIASTDPHNCTCNIGSGSCMITPPCYFANAAPVRTADDYCATGLTMDDQITKLNAAYGARF